MDLKSPWLVTVHNDRKSWDRESHVHVKRLLTTGDVDVALTFLQGKLIYNDVFIMREGHDHVWEDPAHRDTGGKISWRVPEGQLFQVFKTALIGAVMDEFVNGSTEGSMTVVGVVVLTKPDGQKINDLQVWFKNFEDTKKPNLLKDLPEPRASRFQESIEKDSKPKTFKR